MDFRVAYAPKLLNATSQTDCSVSELGQHPHPFENLIKLN